MSTDTQSELYRQWLDDVWGGATGAAERSVSDDVVGHLPQGDVHGPAGLADAIASTRSMFSTIDFRLTVGPIVDGDLLAARWIGTGTTTDGEMTFVGNDILRLEGGPVAEYWAASSAGS